MSARMSACAGVLGLLGGDVVGRAEEDAVAGQTPLGRPRPSVTTRASPMSRIFSRGSLPLLPPGRSNGSGVTIRLAGLMSRWTRPCSWACCKPVRRLPNVVDGVGRGERAVLLDQPGEVDAGDVLHRQVRQRAVQVGLEHGDDVRVVRVRAAVLHLLLEPLAGLRVAEPVRGDDLQGDDAVEAELFRLVDHAHAAAVDLVEDLEPGDDLSGRQREGGVGGQWAPGGRGVLASSSAASASRKRGKSPAGRRAGGAARVFPGVAARAGQTSRGHDDSGRARLTAGPMRADPDSVRLVERVIRQSYSTRILHRVGFRTGSSGESYRRQSH